MQSEVAQIQAVVLCGGSGTRLWPLSRQSLPKQFVPLIAGKSLLQATFERVAGLAPGGTVWTVANSEHRFLVRDCAEAAGTKVRSILEPVGRNTAAAMAAAALNADPEQLLLFLPADHHVPDAAHFCQTVTEGAEAAKQGAIVTFGITPSQPHTGYGYIQIQPSSEEKAKPVIRFVEKPDAATAMSYLAEGSYFWNAGIFLVKAKTLIEALEQHASDILEAVSKAVQAQHADGDFLHLDEAAFAGCRSESIDYAVLEKHANIVMVPFSGAWSDVGSWNAVADLASADANDNRVIGHGTAHQAKSTYIHAPHRPVVALGTENLLIIDTPDAVLVAAQSHAEDVKTVVADLEKAKIPQATEHRHAARPWGEYDCIDEGQRFKVKRITVKPGASLSLQRHHHRAEHWIVVKGTARVTCGEESFLLSENQSTYIPLGTMHRLENPGTIPLEMIEVQSGSYLGEDDIERFDDTYGRHE
ncbi:mannose-1-phosphate guanylyltransferase (GDP) /mannose-6-phosphate isomerase, type 2 [Ectothiorhodosinus mongolicus]|uniref:mannose-1-phosphate guanylyltransferase n=1 Tax=Ectothiorhodosinus mongolicus TaxID=233100 RepID=A0A1R3VQQ4_9GAMM|nr:mannose-1-phosphate guanylyltransferase/mannose-6-phosphate isomerase [Ectothiorhodosinus mongolicus]ULX56739.1 mannose-1-phosphate guanylyltransferase/mannose-6-phosphate isomerase [Ectothiorhodosinus mongolicus]SIT67071.1 mannose-1-phosphate guanylyltransferase (GDP) /mannose-6-phosphate isomerase, type 2 [Ectothiorhodosinus mongolicus]